MSEPAVSNERLSDEGLRTLTRVLREQIRLIEDRLSKTAIPEDPMELGDRLAEARLKMVLVTEILAHRAAHNEARG